MLVEGEPNTEFIVELITMVIENTITTYNDGFADDMSTLDRMYKRIHEEILLTC
jgi:hypothetical protein